MPTYSELQAEYARQNEDRQGEWLEEERTKALQRVQTLTGNFVLAYETDTGTSCYETMVNDDDIRALMEVLKGVKEPNVDVIVHSNGGSPDAADMFGAYLRQKFKNIRVFVPMQAMSAATMIVCGAHEVVMARHSFLGPIDLQLSFHTARHPKMVAAQDVLDQYELMRKDFVGKEAEFWQGPAFQYFPDALVRCRNALAYGEEVARRGLFEVMFAGAKDADERAKKIAADLADHQKHKAHARRLSRTYASNLGLKVTELEASDDLQDAVLTLHHLYSLAFEHHENLAKVVESSAGRIFLTFRPN